MSQRARTGLAALALGMQIAVLYAPRAPAVDSGGIPVDKLVHVAAFALPTAALIAAGVPRGWVLGLMAVHAPLSEMLQGQFLADRSAEGADIVADLVGVALGALVASRLHRPEAVVVDQVG
jgi:VanZ family protein